MPKVERAVWVQAWLNYRSTEGTLTPGSHFAFLSNMGVTWKQMAKWQQSGRLKVSQCTAEKLEALARHTDKSMHPFIIKMIDARYGKRHV